MVMALNLRQRPLGLGGQNVMSMTRYRSIAVERLMPLAIFVRHGRFADVPFHLPELPLQGPLARRLACSCCQRWRSRTLLPSPISEPITFPPANERMNSTQERPHEGRRVGGSRDVAKQDLHRAGPHQRIVACAPKSSTASTMAQVQGRGQGLGYRFRHAVVLLWPGPPPPVRWLAVAQ